MTARCDCVPGAQHSELKTSADEQTSDAQLSVSEAPLSSRAHEQADSLGLWIEVQKAWIES